MLTELTAKDLLDMLIKKFEEGLQGDDNITDDEVAEVEEAFSFLNDIIQTSNIK